MKRMMMVAALMALSLLAEAKVNPIVHYNFGKSGNVTYAVAPEKLTPMVGKGELTAVGRPVFYADAPGDKKMKGEGGILLNGNGDGYKQAEAIGSPADNQLLEIWVKPCLHTQSEEKAQVLLSNGTTKEGYIFMHNKGHWYLISSGAGCLPRTRCQGRLRASGDRQAGQYELGAPLFQKATIKLSSGKSFVIPVVGPVESLPSSKRIKVWPHLK